MSLRWFAFDADAYTGDTAHLTTEEHGAYLLLMLAYYRSEKPLPATDRALASITKLTADRWLECKPALAPFFEERDCGGGIVVWVHQRIELEIADGYEKHNKNVVRARAGGKQRQAIARSKLDSASSSAPSKLETSTLTLTKDSLSARATEPEREEVPPEPDLESERPELTPIDLNFQPPEAVKAECLKDADASTYHLELQKFIYAAQGNGSLSANWTASFQLWWARFIEHSRKPAKGKPRVELNPSPPADDKINWDWHLSRWLKNESTWRRATAGPEPGQPNCKVPAEMFEKFGLDPATGRAKRKEDV